MRLCPTEDGLQVVTDKWVCVHETDCFYHCVPSWNEGLFTVLGLKALRKRKQLKRIAKVNGRFAFDTKEKALEHLRFMKRRQLIHLKREQAFVEKFLDTENLEGYRTDWMLVPGSKELVNKHFVFD